MNLNDLVGLRKHIHMYPELSGQEVRSAEFIADLLRSLGNASVLTGIGGNGIASIFKGEKPGPRILVRAELDALPITESDNKEHRSLNEGLAHLCGHDGHMTILLGLGNRLNDKPPEAGEVVLLFQPAEETGQGAAAVISDPVFERIRPDYAIALHNLPKYPENTIVIKAGNFACASQGIIIQLTGRTSHAAHPEQGLSPARAVAQLIGLLEDLPNTRDYKGFVLATMIHIRMGDIAFGTSPGEAILMLTLRAAEDEDMLRMTELLREKVAIIAANEKLNLSITNTEVFPPTVNDEAISKVVRETAHKQGLKIIDSLEPFRWSEDFGHFSAQFPSVLFGIGAGMDSPALHSPDYDFNDALLTTGVGLMHGICIEIIRGDIESKGNE